MGKPKRMIAEEEKPKRGRKRRTGSRKENSQGAALSLVGPPSHQLSTILSDAKRGNCQRVKRHTRAVHDWVVLSWSCSSQSTARNSCACSVSYGPTFVCQYCLDSITWECMPRTWNDSYSEATLHYLWHDFPSTVSFAMSDAPITDRPFWPTFTADEQIVHVTVTLYW